MDTAASERQEGAAAARLGGAANVADRPEGNGRVFRLVPQWIVALLIRRPVLFFLSSFSIPEARVVEQLHQSFLMMRKVHIHYRDASGEQTERAIEPQYFLLSYPVWYAISWDDLRNDVRIFRCDSIERARLLDEVFRPRRFTQFESAVEAIDVN